MVVLPACKRLLLFSIGMRCGGTKCTDLLTYGRHIHTPPPHGQARGFKLAYGSRRTGSRPNYPMMHSSERISWDEGIQSARDDPFRPPRNRFLGMKGVDRSLIGPSRTNRPPTYWGESNDHRSVSDVGFFFFFTILHWR